VCVTIGWLLAATLTPPVARLQSLAEPQRSPASIEEPAFAERLNLRLREAPVAPTIRRNPFSFGSRQRDIGPSPESAPTLIDAPPITSAPTRPAFAYALSGIGIAGEVRTAVLTDGHGIRIVKVNDTVAGYTVVEITDGSVTLESDVSRQILHLAQ
jgi:hypothetical protein